MQKEKKWTSLRDTYLKKRKETEKRSGSDQGKTEAAAAGQSETGVLTSEATQQGICCCLFKMKSLNYGLSVWCNVQCV